MKQQSLKIFSKEETGPYELPKGWRWVRLGDKDLFHIETGSTPKTDVKEYWQNGNIKWITPKDLGKLTNKFIFDTERKITQDGLNSCSTTIIPKGSIIISTRAPIGHIAICDDEMCFNQGCKGIVIKNKNQVLNDFLYYVLLTKVKEMDALGSGATFKEISRKKLASIQIPLPPLPEQKRIVARIEALFSKIDEIKRLRKETNDLAKTLLQSALHEVFSKADEKGWRWVRLGSICLVRGGKRLPKGDKFSAVPTPFRYIRVSDFEDMSVNVNTIQYVTKDVRNKIKDYIITKEDVYLSIAGTIGKAGTVPEELDKSNLTENAARLIIKNKGTLDKTYLAFCLNSPYVQKIIENFTKIVGQPKLALFRIKEIQIPLAPLPEQKRIVSYLDQISEKQKILLKIYENIDNQITELKQSILNKAFRGGLLR